MSHLPGAAVDELNTVPAELLSEVLVLQLLTQDLHPHRAGLRLADHDDVSVPHRFPIEEESTATP